MVCLPALISMEKEIERFCRWLKNNERILIEVIRVNDEQLDALKTILNSLKSQISAYKVKKYGKTSILKEV